MRKVPRSADLAVDPNTARSRPNHPITASTIAVSTVDHARIRRICFQVIASTFGIALGFIALALSVRVLDQGVATMPTVSAGASLVLAGIIAAAGFAAVRRRHGMDGALLVALAISLPSWSAFYAVNPIKTAAWMAVSMALVWATLFLPSADRGHVPVATGFTLIPVTALLLLHKDPSGWLEYALLPSLFLFLATAQVPGRYQAGLAALGVLGWLTLLLASTVPSMLIPVAADPAVSFLAAIIGITTLLVLAWVHRPREPATPTDT